MKILHGIDLVYLPRFESLLDDPAFVQRVFSSTEIKDDRVEHLAGLFAVKEAFFKATQVKIKQWREIEVLNDDRGKPYIGSFQRLPVGFEIQSMDVSISHDEEYVIGSVVLSVMQE